MPCFHLRYAFRLNSGVRAQPDPIVNSNARAIAKVFLLGWAAAIVWIVFSALFVRFVLGVPVTGYYPHFIFFGAMYLGLIRPLNKYNVLRNQSDRIAP